MKSVLVIEDDENIRAVIEHVLAFEGYPVHSACDGQEALELLERIPEPGLILVDLTMPVMSGTQFLEHKRSDPRLKGIPTVVMTAVHQPTELLESEELLPKPIALDQLCGTLHRLLH